MDAIEVIEMSMAERDDLDRAELLVFAQFLDLIRTALSPGIQNENSIAVDVALRARKCIPVIQR